MRRMLESAVLTNGFHPAHLMSSYNGDLFALLYNAFDRRRTPTHREWDEPMTVHLTLYSEHTHTASAIAHSVQSFGIRIRVRIGMRKKMSQTEFVSEQRKNHLSSLRRIETSWVASYCNVNYRIQSYAQDKSMMRNSHEHNRMLNKRFGAWAAW